MEQSTDINPIISRERFQLDGEWGTRFERLNGESWWAPDSSRACARQTDYNSERERDRISSANQAVAAYVAQGNM